MSEDSQYSIWNQNPGGKPHIETVLRSASKISHQEDSRVMSKTQETENDHNLD